MKSVHQHWKIYNAYQRENLNLLGTYDNLVNQIELS